MPELPEVETTVRGLDKHIKGLRITDFWTDYNSPFHAKKSNIKNPRYLELFRKTVLGKTITGIRRRAKYIIIDLSDSNSIVVHMKMTGHFLYGFFNYNAKNKTWRAEGNGEKKDALFNDPFNRHVRLVFHFDNGKQLAFSDMRRFATITLLKDASFDAIGKEPFDESLTANALLAALIRKRKTPLKQALLDQAIIAGIGNIYGDEILWHAGINPKELPGKITLADAKRILKYTRDILNLSISVGGDSMSDFRTIEGERGGFHPFHKAYKQTGKACQKKNCRGTIQRIVIGGRSAHFCNTHQKLRN